MGFTQKDLGGLIVNQSDNAIQWKVVNDVDVIKMFSYEGGITTTMSDAFGTNDFLEIIDYINDNSIDKNSIVLDDKEQFLSDALIGNEGNQTIIDFVNTLTFEQIEE